MDYEKKIKERAEKAESGKKLLAIKHKMERAIRMCREETVIKVYVENQGQDPAYPITETCQIVGEFRDGVIEAMKKMLAEVDREIEEKFKEDENHGK